MPTPTKTISRSASKRGAQPEITTTTLKSGAETTAASKSSLRRPFRLLAVFVCSVSGPCGLRVADQTEGWPNQIPAVTVHVTNRREICRLTTRLHQRHTEERQCLRLTTRDTPTSTTTRRQGVHLVLRIRMVRLQNLHDQQRLQGNQTHQIPQRTLNGSGSKSRINRTKIPV